MEKPKAIRSDPEARKAYGRWHYEQNKALYVERARIKNLQTRSEVREWLFDYLKTRACLDCGESDPVVLEFDHRESAEKAFTIGEAVPLGYSLKRVKAEVQKCDVRCANCHRRITYKRAGRTHRG